MTCAAVYSKIAWFLSMWFHARSADGIAWLFRYRERCIHHNGQSHSKLLQAACNTVDIKGTQTNQQSDQVIPESPVYYSLFDAIDSYVVTEVQ